MLAASLREVTSRGDAELRRKTLQKHRHQVADEYDAEQGVAKFRPATKIRRPVARIHLTDGDEVAWAGESQNLADPGSARRKRNGAVGFGQGG